MFILVCSSLRCLLTFFLQLLPSFWTIHWMRYLARDDIQNYATATLMYFSRLLTSWFGHQVCSGATYVDIDMLVNKKDGSRMLLIEGSLFSSSSFLSLFCPCGFRRVVWNSVGVACCEQLRVKSNEQQVESSGLLNFSFKFLVNSNCWIWGFIMFTTGSFPSS